MRRVWWIAGVALVACATPRGSEAPSPAVPETDEIVEPFVEPVAGPLAEAPKDTVHATPAEVEAEFRELFRASEAEMLARLTEEEPESPSWDIPITVNDAVERWLDYFQGDGRTHFEIYLTRAGRYEPMMRSILRDEGLPEDLVYLSLIESGFSPRAYSRARAVGLWQFIASTGRLYDLHRTYWVDDRRDPIKATRAAAAHLRDLYDEFGSWYLAAAAYNAGPNRVRRGIARTGSEDFWTLAERRYLRRETRNYVPKLIAAALIAKEPEKYGFVGLVPEAPLRYDVVEVPDATSLDVIAKAAGVSTNAVAELNPQILRLVTPPGQRYEVRVPEGAAEQFEVAYAEIPAGERVTWVTHVVRRGDTLGEIARAYGVSVASIRAANNSVHPRRLRVGQRLVIPRAGRIPSYLASSQPTRSTTTRTTTRRASPPPKPQRPSGPYLTYRVKTGDSLWTISQQYAVSIRDLKSWNGLRSSRIHPGKELRIYSKGE